MAITGRLVSPFVAEFAGFDVSSLGREGWRNVMRTIGRELQSLVAASFAKQRVAGTSALRPNTPEYNAYKARHGYDPRRGHKTGNLQRVLENDRLYSVGPIVVRKNGTGRVRIRMLENRLYGLVPYAEYYEEKKVRHLGILALARTWVQKVAAQIAASVGTAARKFEQTRRGVFAGRPARIRPTVGLTQKFSRNIVGGLAVGFAAGFFAGAASKRAERDTAKDMERRVAQALAPFKRK